MAEKRCETCYYWTRHYHPPTRGTCDVGSDWRPVEASYGCSRWRARTAALPKLTRLLRILRNIEAWEPLGDLDEEYLEPVFVVLEEMAWAVLDAAAKASPTGMAGGGGPEERTEVEPQPLPWEEVVPEALELLQEIKVEDIDESAETGKLLRACLGAVSGPISRMEKYFGPDSG